MSLTFGSLFSGIGGFDLGFERAGMTCAWQVEIDQKCQRILAHHWPDVKRYSDVKQCGSHNLEPVELICGGFPCQDLSVAGKRAGLAGKRSGLWFQFHRILAELEPRWVVIENVPGLLSSSEGRDFAIILQGLVKLGYGVCWRVLDAQYFGVAQRRRRVFVVGSLGDGRSAEVLFEREGSAWDSAPSREKGESIARPLANSSTTNHYDESQQSYVVAQCHGSNVGPMGHLRSGNGGLTGGVPFIAFNWQSGGDCRIAPQVELGHTVHANQTQAVAFVQNANDFGENVTPSLRTPKGSGSSMLFAAPIAPTLNAESYSPVKSSSGQQIDWCIGTGYGVRRLTPTECERLQAFPDGHTAEQSDTARYRQLGNAVCVNVAEWLGRRLQLTLDTD